MSSWRREVIFREVANEGKNRKECRDRSQIVYKERWTGFYQILSNNTQYHITYNVQDQSTENVALFIYLFIFPPFLKLLWLDNKQKESIQVTFEAVVYAVKD